MGQKFMIGVKLILKNIKIYAKFQIFYDVNFAYEILYYINLKNDN